MCKRNCSLSPTTKLRQGNVFTPVCHSVYRGGCLPPPVLTPPGRHPLGRHPPGQTPSPGRHPPLGRHPPPPCPVHAGIHTLPAQCMLGCTPCPVHAGIHTHTLPSACWDMVNKWAVRISLECILVERRFCFLTELLFTSNIIVNDYEAKKCVCCNRA